MFECGTIRHRLRQHPFRLGVLVFEGAQLLRIGRIHATRFGLVFVEGRVGDALLAAEVRRLHPGVVFLAIPIERLIAELALHGPSFSLMNH